MLSDEEREEIAAFISQNPKAGSVVMGTGGVRKMRWARPGSGKSGGLRVLYYNIFKAEEIWLLTQYARNSKSNMQAHELKLIKETIKRGS